MEKHRFITLVNLKTMDFSLYQMLKYTSTNMTHGSCFELVNISVYHRMNNSMITEWFEKVTELHKYAI